MRGARIISDCGGVCVGGRTECDGKCVDLDKDPFNCGACGKGCLGKDGRPCAPCEKGVCKPCAPR